jgi:hypothetical protein
VEVEELVAVGSTSKVTVPVANQSVCAGADGMGVEGDDEQYTPDGQQQSSTDWASTVLTIINVSTASMILYSDQNIFKPIMSIMSEETDVSIEVKLISCR